MTESKLGWGKLSEGQSYFPLVVDVSRAIAALGLGENVGLLLWYVIEKSWGSVRKQAGQWTEPVPCPVNYAELAKLWGIERQHVYKALQWLVRCKILKAVEGGMVVNKKVDSWVRPDGAGPLLTGEKLAYAEAGKSRFPKRSTATQRNPGRLQTEEDRNPGRLRQTEPRNLERLQTSSSKVTPHREERAPGFEKEKAAKAAAEVSGNAAAARPQELSKDQTPRKPAYPDARTPPLPGPHDSTPEQAQAYFDQLWAAFHSPGLCREWWINRRQHDLRAWQAALATLLERGTVIRRLAYLTPIAADWKGVSPSPARPNARPRYRETGPPPPPLRPPLSPERLAELQRANQPKASKPSRSGDAVEHPEQVGARFLAYIRGGDAPRGLHAPETLTGT